MKYQSAPTLEALHLRRLDDLRRMKTCHEVIAVAAAMDYCRQHDLHPPRDIFSEVAPIMSEFLSKEKIAQRVQWGRASGVVSRYRQDLIHFMRWDAVIEVRQKQREIGKQLKSLQVDSDFRKRHPKHFEAVERLAQWVGKTLIRAYEVAAMLLQDSEAFGGPDAIKASYLKVKRCYEKNEGEAARYTSIDPGFLRAIGIPRPVTGSRKVRKITALYDLTL